MTEQPIDGKTAGLPIEHQQDVERTDGLSWSITTRDKRGDVREAFWVPGNDLVSFICDRTIICIDLALLREIVADAEAHETLTNDH